MGSNSPYTPGEDAGGRGCVCRTTRCRIRNPCYRLGGGASSNASDATSKCNSHDFINMIIFQIYEYMCLNWTNINLVLRVCLFSHRGKCVQKSRIPGLTTSWIHNEKSLAFRVPRYSAKKSEWSPNPHRYAKLFFQHIVLRISLSYSNVKLNHPCNSDQRLCLTSIWLTSKSHWRLFTLWKLSINVQDEYVFRRLHSSSCQFKTPV